MQSTVSSDAQLFYDFGHGFREADSSTIHVYSSPAGSFRELSFALPQATIYHFRFDPLTIAGELKIRNILVKSGSRIIQQVAPASVHPFNQISACVPTGSAVNIATVPGANDPGLVFALSGPLNLSTRRMRLVRIAETNAVLFVIALAIIALRKTSFWHVIVRMFATVDHACTALGTRATSEGFIRLDPLAIYVYAGCLLLFVITAALDLNGSSEGMYSAGYGHGPQAKPLLGEPRATRADEWSYVTPDILNQFYRFDRFSYKTSVLGNHDIALSANIPVRHVSTIFRPQFWSFFALPVDYAYAVYWQAKALILVTGVFTFLLWITASSRWALTGALWYFFSPFTQWSYSWPSALAEMIGLLCFATVCLAYLLVGRQRLALAISAVSLAVCSLDFILCAYPPHLIPLFWVAFAVIASWCIASRHEILSRDNLPVRLGFLGIAIALIAFIGLKVYGDLGVAIHAVSQTVYPGQRVLPGGGVSIWQLTSHLFPWSETENHFPAVLGNICEGSGFFWLGPVTLLLLRKLALSPFQRAALIGLWAAFLLLLFWMIFPLPKSFGHPLGLDRVFGARPIPALGLANLGIVALTMAGVSERFRIARRQFSRLDAITFGFAFLALYLLFRVADNHLGRFFSHSLLLLSAAFLAIVMTLLLRGSQLLLPAALVIPLVFLCGAVNPIQRGLPVLTRSALREFVKHRPMLLRGKWLVFSDTPVSSGFLAAAGCDVYTGTRYLPDIDHFSLFASRGLDVNTFNRLGYLDAHAIPPESRSDFELNNNVTVVWDVNPRDNLLKQLGIRYLAFSDKPSQALVAGLRPLSAGPIDGFWLFEIPEFADAQMAQTAVVNSRH